MQCLMRHVHRGTCWSWYVQCDVQYVHDAIWAFHRGICNETFCSVMFTVQYDEFINILSALSTMTCAMCNETCPPWNMLILKLCTAPMCTLCKCNVQCSMRQETCPPWKDRSPAINVPPQMHQQQTKGRKYGANVLLGIWQQQRDQVL